MNNPLEVQHPTISQAERLAREHLRIFAAGDMEAVAANVTSDYLNRRSADEPIEARVRGPEGFKATLRWAQRAFADMRFEVHDVAINGNLVALHVTLHGRQHGPFVVYDSPDGRVTDVFPSNGRSFAARHTHWITVSNGAVSEHDAVRDDLGMAKQLGWIPPNPVYISRMMIALMNERRALRQR
jgi:ketosteroid isomerase-like protein